MMRFFLLPFLLISLAAGTAFGAEVFRWVDEDGTVHFSDRPVEGEESAEKVVLPKAQTFTSPPVSAARKPKTDASESTRAKASTAYREIEIVKPGPDEVVWNTTGEIKVSVAVIPELKDYHSVLLYLDDQLLDSEADENLKFKLTEVVRGSHALHAEVRDAGGASLLKSQPITFTVQQTSLLNQKNPNVIPPPGPRPTG
jgi:hypothetical protein